jgi:predicted amino acid racemase
VALADVSLNSEIEVIRALSKEAVRQGKVHNIVIMIELGDLREGILPGTLMKFYTDVFELPGINVLGLGSQIGCLGGAVPSIDQISHLLLYRELLELKFERSLPLISAGSSVFLSLLQNERLPRAMNHYRIGESLFLGTDLVQGGTIQGLRDDVVLLEGEIAEIKQKSLVPMGETVDSQPFEQVGATENGDDTASIPPPQPGQRGYRALITVGQTDTDVASLTPMDETHQIAGASSDITVVNLGDDPQGLGIGDTIRFKLGYSSLVRLMNDPYLPKHVFPDIEVFEESMPDGKKVAVPRTLDAAVEAQEEDAVEVQPQEG